MVNRESEWIEQGKYLMPSNDIGKGLNDHYNPFLTDVEQIKDGRWKMENGKLKSNKKT